MNNVIIKPGQGFLDLLVSKLTLKTLPFWKSLNATPNHLTTCGLISSLSSIYFLFNRNTTGTIISIIIRAYFDFADGLMARKYKMTSKFGDYYDHIVEYSFALGFLLVLLFKSNNKFTLISIVTIFFILFTIYTGCQEKEYNQFRKKEIQKETSISYLRNICFAPKVFKLFDNITLYLVVIGSVIVYCNETE